MKNSNNLIPAVVYENSKLSKKQIMQENQGKCGIYCFSNLINGPTKKYVGSSQNLKRRFQGYYRIKYLKANFCMRICRALLKYGHENFSLSILEYCSPDKLLETEKYYFKLLKPEYNICKEPSSPMSGRNHSEEAKLKMSERAKGRKGKSNLAS
jgi:group I intron endonuclease